MNADLDLLMAVIAVKFKLPLRLVAFGDKVLA